MSVPITRDDLICQMASKMLLLLAIIDQIVSSVGTLLIGILVARQGGNLIYADFVISMVAVALSNSVLDSVVYSPFVLGYDDRRLDSAVSVAVFHQLPFSIALAAMTIMAGSAVGGTAGSSLVLTALALLLLPLRELARRVSLAVRRPAEALVLDLGFLLLAAVAVEVWLTCGTETGLPAGGGVIGVMGLCSAVLFAAWIKASRLRIRYDRTIFFADMRTSLNIWRWMLPSSLLWFATAQAQPWLIALLSNKKQTAVFAAGFSLAQIVNTLVIGVANLSLPVMRDAYRKQGLSSALRTMLISAAVLFAACLLVSTIVTLGSDRLIGLMYGPAFLVSRTLVGMLCLNVCLGALMLFVSRFLLMIGWGRFDLIGNSAGVALLPVTSYVLVPCYGAEGAAFSLTAENCTIFLVLCGGLLWAVRRQSSMIAKEEA